MSEITKTKLDNLMEQMNTTAAQYASAYNDRKGKKQLKIYKDAAKNALDAYNSALAKDTYKKWAEAGDAVRTAIRTRFVPHAQKCKFKVDDDTDQMTVIFSDDPNYKVNLPAMAKEIGMDKFSNPDWFAMTQKLAFLIAGRLNKECGENPSFEYMIDDAAKNFSFPDDVNPYTDDGVLCALQQVFDAVLFIPSPDDASKNVIHVTKAQHEDGKWYSPQWTYIRESMTKQGKTICTVEISNTGKMTELVADAMYGVFTNATFTLNASEK